MVDKTPQVGGGAPLSGQQFSTKGVKLSDLKNQNKLLFDYFKQSGLNENSYVYSTDIEKLKEAYDEDDNGKLSKKEARAIFGEDVSRRDIKKAIKTLDLIAQTDLQGKGTFPVKVSEHETEYYTENNFLQSSVYDDNEKQIKTLYGENKQLRAQIVDKKNEDGTTTRASFLINEYNDDGTLYSCQEKIYGENDSFEETTITYLNGDQNKPSKIEHNVNGNKKVSNIEYNSEGKKIRSVTVANGQKAEVVYDEQERPLKQFESPLGSDNITIREYKYNGVGTSPAEVLTTNPDGTQENAVYGEDGKFMYKEQIVKLNPEDLKPKEEKAAAKKNVSAKVHVPDNWGNIPTSFRHASGITETKDADAALKALLNARNIKETEVDADKLKADLIKYNPSLFNKDGKVKDNAKWDRLDLPKDIKAQYGKTEAAQNEDKTSAPSGYVPIDSSVKGIPDPKERFLNQRNVVEFAGAERPVETPKAKPKAEVAQNEDKTSTPSGYVPIDSSLKGIPDPKERFLNQRNVAEFAGAERPVETPNAKPKADVPAQEHNKLLAEQTKVQKAIPELAGQVTVTQNKDGKYVYKPITGVLAGREYESVDALRAALDLANQGIYFPKNE